MAGRLNLFQGYVHSSRAKVRKEKPKKHAKKKVTPPPPFGPEKGGGVTFFVRRTVEGTHVSKWQNPRDVYAFCGHELPLKTDVHIKNS